MSEWTCLSNHNLFRLQRLSKRWAPWMLALWLLSWSSAAFTSCCDVSVDLLPHHQTVSIQETTDHDHSGHSHSDATAYSHDSERSKHCDEPGGTMLDALGATLTADKHSTFSLDFYALPSVWTLVNGRYDTVHVAQLNSEHPSIRPPRLYLRFAHFLI